MVVIIDYKMNNTSSIKNMLKKAGAKEIIITDDPIIIDKAQKIILPGVGSFDKAMDLLNKKKLIKVIKKKALIDKVPFLGICLGMQLMTNSSEEGQLPGLGLVDASCHKFSASNDFKVPHMGWNKTFISKSSKLIPMETSSSRFYFVHSYYVKLNNLTNELLSTNYVLKFTSAFEVDNLIGVQFHPEKSHKFGLELFKRFIREY